MPRKILIILTFVLCFSEKSHASLEANFEIGARKFFQAPSNLSTDTGGVVSAFLYFPMGEYHHYVAAFELPFFTPSSDSDLSGITIVNSNVGFDFNLSPGQRLSVHLGLFGGPSVRFETFKTGEKKTAIGINAAPYLTAEIYTGSFIPFLRFQYHYYKFFGSVHSTAFSDGNVNAGFKIYFE